MNSKIKYRPLTDKIIKAFYSVYNELGYGFLESVYEKSLLISLRDFGLKAISQQPINVYFKDNNVGDFIADIIVEDKVILELKAVEHILRIHEAQLINYLKATKIEIGLLLNFSAKPEFKRYVYSNSKK
jgi:GxxExxY protein